MKKILSFLTKKPLALAAVALFSMSSFAQETGAPAVEGGSDDDATPAELLEKLKVDIWERVSENNPLYYFDKVTIVDEYFHKIYADKDGKQIPAKEFNPEFDASGSAIPEGASYFFVAQGVPEELAFALNKELKKDKDGNYLKQVGPDKFEKVAMPAEGETPTEGAVGAAEYLKEGGELQTSALWTNVSWLWEDVYTKIKSARTDAQQARFLAYNTEDGIFAVTDPDSYAVPAVLYKAAAKYKPYFDPEEGYYPANPDGNIVKIINPKENKGGTIQYYTKKNEDGTVTWLDYPEGGVPVKTGVETTITARVVFDKGNTGEVSSTYLFYEIEDPTITPEPKEGDMVDENGEFNVTIATTEEGLKYTVGKGTEVTPDDETEVEVNIVEGLELPATVTVTAKSTKTITFKGKDVEVESDPATTATYIIGAYPAPQEVEFFAESETGVKPEGTVDLGEDIYVWFEVDQKGYGIEYDGTKDANKKLTLTFFDKEDKEIGTEVVDIAPAEDGRVAFTVPTDEAYANSYFTFDVPEGFYYTYTGEKKANQVPTPEKQDVKFYTGLLVSTFILDVDLALDNKPTVTDKYLTTDDVYVDCQIYLSYDEQDVEVDFADPKSADPTYGAWFKDNNHKEVTAIERVEKVEGTPNIFRVFFINEEGYNAFVEKALIEEQLVQKGYILGFPAGTFVSGDSKQKDDLSANIYFNEAVELTMKPVRGAICEGLEGVAVKVTAKGKIFGTEYNTPYWKDKENKIVNPEESKIVLNDGVEVTITGTDIHGDEVNVKAKLQKEFPVTPERQEFKYVYREYNSKDLFFLNIGEYDAQLEEEGALKFVLQEDSKMNGGDDYTVSVPAGAFKINNGESKAFTDKLDVQAHPVYAVTARPYTFDKDGEVKTLVLDGIVTLDDLIKGNADEDKYFEKDLRKYLKDVKILVDAQEITEWTVKEVSKPAQDENDRWYETFVVEIPLNEPITDVEKHHIVINAHAFDANVCDSKKMELDVYPEVKYAIEQVTYCISTAVPSVTYFVWATLPDDSYLNEAIQYAEIGDTKTEETAAALNNAVNPTTEDAKYPVIETAKEVGTYKGHPATLFTVKFPAGTLKPWVAKMNFPVGTVQAEGYVANDEALWNNIKIIPDIEFDATSSWDDFLTPNKPDKNKVYNIKTTDKKITLHLTGYNKYDNTNANNHVELKAGSELLISDAEGNPLEDVTLEWKPVKKAGYTVYDVTFVNEKGEATGLQEGSYTMTVQEHNVINTYYDPKCNPKINCDNQDAFELTINVEDFAEDAEVEITTKTYDFDVPVSDGPITVKEGATATLNGKTVQLSTIHEGEIRVTLLGDPDATAYDFIQKPGTYTFEIPANTFEGEYAPCTVAIPVTVDVVFEFVDSNTKTDNFGNDLVTTKEEVLAAKGVQKKMYYTRNFKSTRLQMLAVPFDIAKDEVDFSIARINAVTIDDATEELKANFVYINGEDATAYANKPYAIKPAAEGLVKYTFENKEVFEAKVAEGEDAIRCSTTKVRFDFKNTIEETTGDFLTLGKTEDGTAGIGVATELPAWRWYVETSDKTVKYVKVAINGVDVDATGIDFVEAAEGDNLIFNVAGQKLNTAAKGKVNIINGKKVFVK